jgi:hypothetical protein
MTHELSRGTPPMMMVCKKQTNGFFVITEIYERFKNTSRGGSKTVPPQYLFIKSSEFKV